MTCVDSPSLHDTQYIHEHNGDIAHASYRSLLQGKAHVCIWYTVGISLHTFHDAVEGSRHQTPQGESVAKLEAIQLIILTIVKYLNPI